MDYKIFGCKTNKFFLNKRLNFFLKNKEKNKENAIVITSCVVTDNAKKKFIHEVKNSLKEYKKVYLTGCGAYDKGKKIAEKKFYEQYPELEIFSDKIELLGESPDGNFLYSEKEKEEELYTTKKFIVIQNGCDSNCSFCLTIAKRGSHRSRPVENIIQEILDFEKQGGKEIVITGINLAAYGSGDTNTFPNKKFADFIQEILDKTLIPRIKISSIGPEFLEDYFFKVVENERILPHFHFSIQSFSDQVLGKMYRHYSEKKLDEVLTKIRNLNRPDKEFISIGADLIVGFPGETEEDFQKTLDGIEKYGITKLHAFPFSPHLKGDNVPAGNFKDQISEKIKKERMKRISEIGNKTREKFLEKNRGTTKKVLVEGLKNGRRQGRTENYIQVEVDIKLEKGEIIDVKI